MQASVRLDHQLLAADGEHDVHAMLELHAPEPAETEQRPPLRLALVLDRSGSMAGEKLAVAKRSAQWLVGRLRAQDELAVVAYDDRGRLLAPLAPVDPPSLHAALDRLGPGGSTNLSGGWMRGLEQLERAPADGRRKILLLTDGLANVGVTDPGTLAGLAERARGRGVGTTTIGFGADFDEELLEAMADAGGGNYHYAATPDSAPGIFASEFDALSRLVAQNVTVEIRPAPAVDLVAILNRYPAVAPAEGVQVELGDAYGGERRRLVFSLRVPHVRALGPAKVAELVLRYVSVGDAITQHEVTIPVTVNLVSAAEAAAAAPDLAVREEVLVLKAAQARDDAIARADAGDHTAADDVLARTALELRAEGRPEEADALEELRPSVAPPSYDAAARKRLHFGSNLRRRRARPLHRPR
ncbi:MAG: VWA domain-containing protein [Thermoleophilia bacterium]|nr:VWA domain-containing protein [Thermoleophilia bacterium]